ncbi:hypothetical protein CLS_24650 [[Clostridium] cf. saccharolyticum K10]|nr:hypothetical protein CLS_24650 [[Clostridium] cf. saccharolyticum K10]
MNPDLSFESRKNKAGRRKDGIVKGRKKMKVSVKSSGRRKINIVYLYVQTKH